METNKNINQEKAAIAYAIHLYQESKHDKESGVLTITNEIRNKWGSVLNPRL